MSGHPTIEVVRGRLGDERAAQLLAFWAREAGLGEAEGRERLPQVVCVALDADGEVAGACSAYPSPMALLGGRAFWIYRSLVRADVPAAWPALANTAFHALEAEAGPGDDAPFGLAMLIDDRDLMEREREAVWSWPGGLYAGYLRDGRQVRLRYFETAMTRPVEAGAGFYAPLDPAYRVEPFAEQDAIDADAIVELWRSERILSVDEARRRLDEVLLVASHDGEPVGVSTVYLDRNQQLGMDLWHYRTFVAAAHRGTHVAWALLLASRDLLQYRFVAGLDTRAAGIAGVIEHESISRRSNDAGWDALGFSLIGEDGNGHAVRVHYFPGALVPPPSG